MYLGGGRFICVINGRGRFLSTREKYLRNEKFCGGHSRRKMEGKKKKQKKKNWGGGGKLILTLGKKGFFRKNREKAPWKDEGGGELRAARGIKSDRKKGRETPFGRLQKKTPMREHGGRGRKGKRCFEGRKKKLFSQGGT